MSKSNIAFIDLATQRKKMGEGLNAAIQRVLDHGCFIMGPEIATLEKKLVELCGAKHAISCSNGTDAIALILMAKELKSNDAVFVPSFTFAATAEVVAWVGASPVFVDVLPDTFNMDPQSLKKAILLAKHQGLNPKAVISVDMFGQPADFDAIEVIAEEHQLWVISDAAQSFGASYSGRKAGTLGLATSTSFFPSKPLACYGDGGAIFTEDDELAKRLRSLRLHGQGSHKYDYVHIGMNGRMDTLQAAILLKKIELFPDELILRQNVASYYNKGLSEVVITPTLLPNVTSAWAQYTIVLKPNTRDRIIEGLTEAGIPTAVHYPKPLHSQQAYKQFHLGNDLSVSEQLANTVLSLPMHPYLEETTQDFIIDTVRKTVKEVTGLKQETV